MRPSASPDCVALPDRHRKRPAFAVLNGPLMARPSLVRNPLEHPAQRRDETGVLVGNDQPPPVSRRSFWRWNARQYTSTSESPTSDRGSRGRRWRSPRSPRRRHRGDLPGAADVQVCGVEEHVGNVVAQQPGRNAVTDPSSPAQIRDTSDFEMPASTPSAASRPSIAPTPLQATPCYPKNPPLQGLSRRHSHNPFFQLVGFTISPQRVERTKSPRRGSAAVGRVSTPPRMRLAPRNSSG